MSKTRPNTLRLPTVLTSVLILTLLLLTVAQVSGPVTGAAMPDAAQLRIGDGGSAVYTIAPGEQVTVPVWVISATDLGAATMLLAYDPAVVRVVACTRTASADFNGGVCNPTYALDVAKLNIISIEGVSGDHHLYNVTFEALGGDSGATSTDLVLTAEYFADFHGDNQDVTTSGGRIDVEGQPPAGDAILRVGDSTNGGVFTLPLDGEVEVQVGVQGADQLGAATVSLHYDPTVVRPVSCTAGSEASFGYCNLWAGEGLIRMNAISQDGFNGDVILFTLSFAAADGAEENDQSALTLMATTFDDIFGEALPYELVPGTITIMPAEGNVPQVFLQVGDGPYSIAAGESIIIPVLASIVTGNALGAVTLVVEYDPTIAQATSCTLNRDTTTNGFEGGGCNLNHGVGQIMLNALSAAGVSGATTIAWIEFEGVGAEGDVTQLQLGVDNLADTGAKTLKYQIETWSLSIAGPDDDGDGIASNVEAGAPNDGDGDDDGTQDAEQEHVASLPNIVGDDYITLKSPEGTSLVDVRATGDPSPATAPIGNIFPLGFLSFKVQGLVPGSAVTVEVFMPEVTVNTYYKFGPTAAIPANHWYEFSYNNVTGAEFLSNPNRIMLHFVDGGRGDHDLTINGEVSDPGGAAETVLSASYEMTKVLMGAEPFRTNRISNFTISLTNTGDIPLTELGISDHYDNTYLTFHSSDPPADDTIDDGVLTWSNLVAGTPGLAPGESISVDVSFWTNADTTALLTPQGPCQGIGQTCNVVITDSVVADPGGGQAPQNLDEQQAWDDVRIEYPTAVRIAQLGVDYVDGNIRLTWETVEESDILAFNICRRADAGESALLTEQPLVANMAGQSGGGSYVYVDETVSFGESYDYVLEVITTNMSTWRMPLGSVIAQQELHLPMMTW